jgi:hypothetical protein
MCLKSDVIPYLDLTYQILRLFETPLSSNNSSVGGEPITGSEYFSLGAVTEFKHSKFLGDLFRGYTPLKNLINWGEGWGMYPPGNSLVFVDNHDNQRGVGAGSPNILTFRLPRLYKMASAFMLAHPYGTARVMSSFYWEEDWQGDSDKNDWIGPPQHDGNIDDVVINPDLGIFLERSWYKRAENWFSGGAHASCETNPAPPPLYLH